jgi:transposase-like protein
MRKRKKLVPQKKQTPTGIEETIRLLARKYADRLKKVIDERIEEMKSDDTSHFLIYQVLGVSDEEGRLVDEYQNKGRFLYKHAGSFLEESAKLCFLENFPESGSVRIPNTQGRRPKTFEIDCLVARDAIEIKWRDATTDGDHITKEHTRIRAIVDAGHTPIRVMFYYPNRAQAIKIQQTLETLYKGVNGQYYYGDAAWQYVKNRTGVDLLAIMQTLAQENATKN